MSDIDFIKDQLSSIPRESHDCPGVGAITVSILADELIAHSNGVLPKRLAELITDEVGSMLINPSLDGISPSYAVRSICREGLDQTEIRFLEQLATVVERRRKQRK